MVQMLHWFKNVLTQIKSKQKFVLLYCNLKINSNINLTFYSTLIAYVSTHLSFTTEVNFSKGKTDQLKIWNNFCCCNNAIIFAFP